MILPNKANSRISKDRAGPLFGGHGGGGGSSVELVALTSTPTSRWHPQFSDVTESGGRVTAATDLMGLAAVTEGAAGVGPFAMIDANGRKFWRLTGAEYLNVAAALSLNGKSLSVAMVGRFHRSSDPSQNSMFCVGNAAQGTTSAWGRANFTTYKNNNEPAYLSTPNVNGYALASPQNFLVGSQMQVVTLSSDATRQRLGLNGNFANGAGGFNLTNTGAEIGRYAHSPGASGNWGTFDLYEMVVYNTGLSDANLTTLASELQIGYGITDVTGQIVLHGDSITKGVPPATFSSGKSGSMVLTDPGAAFVPAGYRVMTFATSGATTTTIITDRDVTNKFSDKLLTDNVVVLQIGFNNLGVSTAQQIYDAIVAYLNTTTTGMLQRGWNARVMCNIAGTNATFQAKIVTLRALLLDPQFLTDTLSNTGQTYEGKVSVVSTHLIEYEGDQRFVDSTDAANTTYISDGVHPTELGNQIMVTGGATPEYGVTFGIS